MVSDGTFKADTYTLAESGGPSGYTASAFSCTNGVVVTGAQITLANGQSTVCTINNNDQAPSLELDKTVTNDNGGDRAEYGVDVDGDGDGWFADELVGDDAGRE